MKKCHIIYSKLKRACSNCHCGYVVIISLLSIYILDTYFDQLLHWYDETIIFKAFSQFKSNVWSKLIVGLYLYFLVKDILKKYQKKYQISILITTLMFWQCMALLNIRYFKWYKFEYVIYPISYWDILWITLLLYIFLSLFNCIRNKKNSYTRVNTNKELFSQLLTDNAIVEESDDVLNFKSDIDNVINVLKQLNCSHNWSIAVTGEWGSGKSSYMNILKKKLEQDGYDILEFNPRYSTSLETIQTDFFIKLSAHLSKYRFGISYVIKKYLTSLHLPNELGWIDSILINIVQWSTELQRKELANTFEKLSQPLIVIIDDFDRLAKEEVMEVLKILDGNANFPNFISLTAYDKMHMNKLFNEYSYGANDGCFTDKFFQLELSIPKRQTHTYLSILRSHISAIDKVNYNSQLMDESLIVAIQYLSTIRDIKRYINLLIVDYSHVRGEVSFTDFLLLTLIKYKFMDEYNSLFNRLYLSDNAIFEAHKYWRLKNDIVPTPKSSAILKCLFPSEDTKEIAGFRRIFNQDSFDSYFVNRPISNLSLNDLYEIYGNGIDYRKIIRDWGCEEKKISDFIQFIDYQKVDDFTSKEYFIRYVQIVAFAATLFPNSNLKLTCHRLLYSSNLKNIENRYKIEISEYKRMILHSISDISLDPYLHFIRDFFVFVKARYVDEQEYLLKAEDVSPIIFSQFQSLLSSGNINEDELLLYLYDCVDDIEKNTKHRHLNENCCSLYRRYITLYPSWYVANFVRLGSMSSSADFNSISCEPFYQQIFGSDSALESFIEQCVKNNIPHSLCMKNFWEIYKANDFNPIEFRNQGNVQKRINNGLKSEVEDLHQLQWLNNRIDELQLAQENNTENEETIRYRISEAEQILNDISLYIKLNGDVRNKINKIKAI